MWKKSDEPSKYVFVPSRLVYVPSNWHNVKESPISFFFPFYKFTMQSCEILFYAFLCFLCLQTQLNLKETILVAMLEDYYIILRAVRAAAILFFVLRRFPLPLVSFPSLSLLATPNQPCQSERNPKARHEADSFEPTEWSERLTPGQSGWLGAATVGSIPVLAFSLFLRRQNYIYRYFG